MVSSLANAGTQPPAPVVKKKSATAAALHCTGTEYGSPRAREGHHYDAEVDVRPALPKTGVAPSFRPVRRPFLGRQRMQL